jgi:hypothetical protein
MLLLGCVTAAVASCAQVEADVPEATVTKKAVSFQGIPGGSQLGEVSTTQTFTLTSDDLSWAKSMNAQVYVVEVKFSSVGVDLSFIHDARVIMADGAVDSSTPPAEIINYERTGAPIASSELSVKTSYPIDVTKLWASKTIVITMQLVGIFPEQAWHADVTLNLGGKISYKL